MTRPFDFEAALIRPTQTEKAAPCGTGCPNGVDVRRWIGVIAQRDKLGYTWDEALEKAWTRIVDRNPFPATTGRVCPHPCESGCTRSERDDPVAINALERFVGDWAIERGLGLPLLETDPKPERIGVIGAGPAGLSFAYQMARRGYSVTVYERRPEPGGMLRYGIPRYRLPTRVLAAEIERIVALGVDLRLGTEIGRDATVEELRAGHDVLFLGIGAQSGRGLGVPGEAGSGVLPGAEYLSRVNQGRTVDLGSRVVVVGGGNTAIDAARAARRADARVTVLYRRTREEMPAVAHEIDEAEEEGVEFVFLAAPVEIRRNGGRASALRVQRMALGEPDATGRRAPVPIEGSFYELEVDTVIPAISQVPRWDGLEGLAPEGPWMAAADGGRVRPDLWAGGDVLHAGIAALAISQGRLAAESIHTDLRGGIGPPPPARPGVSPGSVKHDLYPDRVRTEPRPVPVEERLAAPDVEVSRTFTEAEARSEVSRCLSCGLCFGCQHCFTYCNPGGYTRLEEVEPGAYFALSLDVCEGCGKCIDLCPCGFLSPDGASP